jgi:hypothetical protein
MADKFWMMDSGSEQGRSGRLTLLKRRIPPREDLVPVFAACIFVVFSWSIVIFLYKLPGWLKFLNAWTIAGILAYELLFSLLESTLSFGLLLGLAILLPGSWLRNRFAVQGTLLVLLLAFWAGLLNGATSVQLWSELQLLLGAALILASIVVSFLLIHRSRLLNRAVRGLAGRVTAFLYVYLPLSALSLIVIVVRNVR